MPLPSSKNIGLMLGKGGKGSAGIVDELKLQHAEELAQVSDEHAKQIELLEKELEQCRAEIETLKEISDEHSDIITALPSPSKSLKFVKNTSRRKERKALAAVGRKNASSSSLVAALKAQHKKDLARAAEIYAKKLHALKMEVDQYKKETEALKASRRRYATEVLKASKSREGKVGRDGADINPKTGVAEKDKENATSDKSTKQGRGQRKAKLHHQEGDVATNGFSSESLDWLDGNLRERYERLFQKSYVVDQDHACQEAISSADDILAEATAENHEIDALCKELNGFVKDVRIQSCFSVC